MYTLPVDYFEANLSYHILSISTSLWPSKIVKFFKKITIITIPPLK